MAPSTVQENSLPNVVEVTFETVRAYSLIATVTRKIVVIGVDTCQVSDTDRLRTVHRELHKRNGAVRVRGRR
jgi:hypothetical protein